MTAQIATALYVSSQNATDRNDQAAMDLVDDLMRASRSEVAAERLLAMSRAYALTHEPELLARADAADAKLTDIVRGLAVRVSALGEGPLFESLLASTDAYRDAFGRFLADVSVGPTQGMETFSKQMIPARERFKADVEEFMSRRQHQIAGLHAATRVQAARAIPVMVGICALGSFASILLAWFALQRTDDAASAGDETREPSGTRVYVAEMTRSRPPGRLSALPPEGGSVLRFSLPADDGGKPR